MNEQRICGMCTDMTRFTVAKLYVRSTQASRVLAPQGTKPSSYMVKKTCVFLNVPPFPSLWRRTLAWSPNGSSVLILRDATVAAGDNTADVNAVNYSTAH